MSVIQLPLIYGRSQRHSGGRNGGREPESLPRVQRPLSSPQTRGAPPQRRLSSSDGTASGSRSSGSTFGVAVATPRPPLAPPTFVTRYKPAELPKRGLATHSLVGSSTRLFAHTYRCTRILSYPNSAPLRCCQ
jgi:hypothetical protein